MNQYRYYHYRHRHHHHHHYHHHHHLHRHRHHHHHHHHHRHRHRRRLFSGNKSLQGGEVARLWCAWSTSFCVFPSQVHQVGLTLAWYTFIPCSFLFIFCLYPYTSLLPIPIPIYMLVAIARAAIRSSSRALVTVLPSRVVAVSVALGALGSQVFSRLQGNSSNGKSQPSAD